MNQACTIVARTASTDAYGNETQVDGTSVLAVGYFEMQDAKEIIVGRETYVTDWKIFLPADETITAGAKITFTDTSFEVIGEPHAVWNPRLRQTSHVEANVRKVV